MGSLANVRPDQRFVLRDGRQLRNLVELADALQGMDADTFHHHVTGHKNDFASWVHDCIRDDSLSREMRMAANKDDLISAVKERIHDEVGRSRAAGFEQDRIIADIERLNSSISEESFIRAYHEGKYSFSIATGPEQVKETDHALTLFKHAKGEKTNWHDNFSDLPIFSADLPMSQSSLVFMKKLDELHAVIAKKDKHHAKVVYSDLKREFESLSMPTEDKRNIHLLLSNAYHDIVKLE